MKGDFGESVDNVLFHNHILCIQLISGFSLAFQSNSIYGKTMQNVRDYIEVKLHTNADNALKAASNPTFKHYSIIDEDLVQTNHYTPVIRHNTPIAIGVTILELVRP